MKVKYLLNDGQLAFGKEYNVFAVQEWNTGEKKIYISDHDSSGNYYITPFDFDYFNVTDTNISKYWNLGIDQFGQLTIGIPETFEIERFWEKYYDNDNEIINILNIYYKIGKSELFNVG